MGTIHEEEVVLVHMLPTADNALLEALSPNTPTPAFVLALLLSRAAFAMGLLATKKDDSELAEALHLEAVLVLDRLPEVRMQKLIVQLLLSSDPSLWFGVQCYLYPWGTRSEISLFFSCGKRCSSCQSCYCSPSRV